MTASDLAARGLCLMSSGRDREGIVYLSLATQTPGLTFGDPFVFLGGDSAGNGSGESALQLSDILLRYASTFVNCCLHLLNSVHPFAVSS